MSAAGTPAFDRTGGRGTDICLVVEGCYPHIMGGVSSWIDWLMRNLPQHSFSLVSVVSGNEPRAAKYAFPPNLARFSELDLNGSAPAGRHGRFKIDTGQSEAFAEVLAELVTKGGVGALSDLISQMDNFPSYPTHQCLTKSEFAWQVVCAMYRRLMPEASFIDFYWAWQSLIGGLYAVLLFPLPPARIYHTISTGYARPSGGAGRN